MVLHQESELVLTDVTSGGQQVLFKTFDLGAVTADQGWGGGLDLGEGQGLLLERQDRLATRCSRCSGDREKSNRMSWTPFQPESRIGSSSPMACSNTPMRSMTRSMMSDSIVPGVWKLRIADLLLGLSDPVDAADALLDLHRVPREVVVDDGRAELEVETLARHPGGEEDVVRARHGKRP